MFTAQVSHYENLTALHKLISIVLQLANQIKQKIPAKSCGAEANFLKLLRGRGCSFSLLHLFFLMVEHVSMHLLLPGLVTNQ